MFELADRSLARDIMEQFERLDCSACYCSVFDECWVTHLTNLQAEPVKQCPIPAVPFGELAELSDG